MTNELGDELDEFRRELKALGVSSPKPGDFGLAFRDSAAFFDADTAPTPVARRRRMRWAGPAAAALVAVVLGAIVLVAQQFPDSRTEPRATPSPDILPVSQVLRDAAESSGKRDDESDAPYWMVVSIQQQGELPSEKRSVWLGNGRPGLVIDDFGRADLPPANFGLQKTSLSWDELVTLNPDPIELRAFLARESGDMQEPLVHVAKLAVELLAESPAPPALRRALWQVLADLPNVRSLGVVKDELGREGYGLAFGRSSRASLEVIIDSDEGRVLQLSTAPSKAGGDASRSTFVSQGPAATLPTA